MANLENIISASLLELSHDIRTIFAANSVSIKIDSIGDNSITMSIDLNSVNEEGRRYSQITDSRVVWNETDYNLHMTMYVDPTWVVTLSELNEAFDKVANIIKLSLDKVNKLNKGE